MAALVAAGLAVGTSAAHAGGLETGIEFAVEAFAWATSHVRGILSTAYDRAPVLVTVLAALLIIPLTALTALVAHGLQLKWTGRGTAPLKRAHVATFKPTQTPAGPHETPWPATAWLAIEGMPHIPLPKMQGLVRIGRHDDNDIRLGHTSVHRHHAIIHRTPDAQFIIMDLSGPDGNGVVVNGERRDETPLKPGDAIVLGEMRLRFESAPL